ncbi:hypothetical protein NDN08_005719 [Rhodosorus marinus]|uniref:SnoaL-like domain-containing protein n=1 Tax=Rhodosorus marinus TaxID=101924 RepID=A0AAV8V2E1_9RHOD|nr:hypothetical protein NDN08_005719 [Rhodosorus marinus]
MGEARSSNASTKRFGMKIMASGFLVQSGCGCKRLSSRGLYMCEREWKGTSKQTPGIVKALVSALTAVVTGIQPQAEEAIESFSDLLSADDVLSTVKDDYEQRQYFLTGDISRRIYLQTTEFIDPTVTVKGLQNWERNIQSINRFITDERIDLLNMEKEQGLIRTRWRLVCTVTLPWRPVLDVYGQTEHFIDESSGRVAVHVESWDCSASEALLQLLKPGPPKTTDSASGP